VKVRDENRGPAQIRAHIQRNEVVLLVIILWVTGQQDAQAVAEVPLGSAGLTCY